MKLTVLGGGGVRSPFLAKSLAYHAHRIHLSEVVFLDCSAENLSLFGEIAKAVFHAIRPDIHFTLSEDPIAALSNADYIITTLRVGGDHARAEDERIALEHHIIGQETTGFGGFAMALRSIPTILEYCKLIETYASANAILFNFTNPSGMVTEAILKSGFTKQVYGICDAPSELIRELPKFLHCSEEAFQVECYGLNHLSWFTHFTVNQQDVTEQLVNTPELYQKTYMQYFDPALIRLFDNQLFNEYLYYYYYQKDALAATLSATETRGEQIARINQEMKQALQKINVKQNIEQAFDIWLTHYLRRENTYMENESQKEKANRREKLTLKQFIELPDTGGYAGVAIDILDAVNSQTSKRIVVSIRNNGILSFLEEDDVIEISCDLNQQGIHPVKPQYIPVSQQNMIATIKEYERLTVNAILQKNKALAVKALTIHPLVGSWHLANKLTQICFSDPKYQDWL